MKLYETINIKKGVTAFIGGGGKTSIIDKICHELYLEGKSVVFTTTTHIFPPDEKFYGKPIINPSEKYIEEISKQRICVVGKSIDDKGKLTGVNENILKCLEKYFDYVLVEADGSKRMPLKFWSDHEPVIPQNCNNVVAVLGLSAVGKKVCDCCFRYELKNIDGDLVVTLEFIYDYILKDILKYTKSTLILNQSDKNYDCSLKIADNAKEKGFENIVISSLIENNWERRI